MEFEIYTDESYITGERYRSIAAFSYKTDHRDKIYKHLTKLLKESSINEFKWQKLKDAKYKFGAIKLLDYILNNISNYDLRMDIVIWDTYDNRHKIQGRDDDANFERMFFHLLKTTLRRRPRNSSWSIYPDQKHGINWDTIHDCIEAVGKHIEYHRTLFGDFFTDPFYHIKYLKEIDSSETPCCQVADLFAGLSVFSINCYSKFCKWKEQEQPSLFETEKITLSNREKVRFEVIQYLDEECKKRKLGVSLNSNQGFYTYQPKNPINFWRYTPQHEKDKAPIKFG